MICAVVLVVCVISTPALSQEDGSTAAAQARGTSASGLEIAVIEISEAPQRDEFGQALVRMGSCPPGVAPAGMEGVMTVIPLPGRGAVVRLELKAATGSVLHELALPVVIDTEGERHRPYGPSFLPHLEALQGLAAPGETLLCEFPFDVLAAHVRAIEFAGVRLSVKPE